MNFLRSFAAFWYDFIVGDSWELAAGVLAVLALGKLLDVSMPSTAEAILFLLVPAAIIATLAVSLARAER